MDARTLAMIVAWVFLTATCKQSIPDCKDGVDSECYVELFNLFQSPDNSNDVRLRAILAVADIEEQALPNPAGADLETVQAYDHWANALWLATGLDSKNQQLSLRAEKARQQADRIEAAWHAEQASGSANK